MKRLNFIRKSILAAAGLLILPKVIEPTNVDVIQAAIDQVQNSNFKPTKCIVCFKVTDRVLLDEYLLNKEIRLACKNIGDRFKLIETSIGFTSDDFCKNIHTVKLTFLP